MENALGTVQAVEPLLYEKLNTLGDPLTSCNDVLHACRLSAVGMLAPMQLGGPAKRARCSPKLILPHHVSLRSAHQLLQQLGPTTVGYSTFKREEAQEVDNISTPYGNLLVRLELELVEGGTWKSPICNPMALLYHMCK